MTADKRPRRKPGPAQKPIDLDLLAKLGTIHCTMAECAAMLGCAADRFIRDKVANRVYYEAREKGKMSLRRRQFQLAMEGDKTMLVWLGKNMLAQTDRAAVEHSGPDRGPIETRNVTEEQRSRVRESIRLIFGNEMQNEN